MHKRNISGIELSNAISSEDILGKDVIDLNGTFIGVVERVMIDPKKLIFMGISVDKGFLKRGLTIGRNYIDRISTHAVFLKIKVTYEIKGKIVFDKDGTNLGTVSSIDLHGVRNEIKFIHVRISRFHSLFKRELVIPSEYIESIGENVILNVKKEQLTKIKEE